MPSSADATSKRRESSAVLITRACDACRKKKIRCEPVDNACAQCIKYKTHCHFTQISVTRRPRRPAKRVEELEQRLKLMEGELKRAMQGQQIDPDHGSMVHSPQMRNEESQVGTMPQARSILHNAFDAVPLVTGESNAALDLIAPTQSAPFPSRQPNIPYQSLEPISNAFTRPTFKPLPSKERALQLISKSFQGFNAAYPIFDEATFMSTFEDLYTVDIKSNNPSWWACLNVVLALTHQFRAKASADMDEDREAWGYFQNALAATNQLMTMQSTLASVQALLGMAIAILGTPHQGPVALLASTAIKLAQKIGLHRQCQVPGLSPAEIEERKRVFWVAFSIDKDISLQTRQPPTQNDDDMDIELPSEKPNTLILPGEKNATAFYFRSRLAILQGQIYKHLLSVNASKQSPTQRAIVAKNLETKLEAWRASVPPELFSEYWGPTTDGPSSDDCRHPVHLQLSYFQSIAIIHESLPTIPWYQEIQASSDDIRLYILSAPMTYATEARNAIRLLNVTPRRKFACVWTVLHIFITAATTLLTNTISNPSDPLARADLEILQPLLNILGKLARSGRNNKVAEIYQSCLQLFGKARAAVESSNAGNSSWNPQNIGNTGSTPGQKENIDQFLQRMENIQSGYEDNVSMTYPGVLNDFEESVT